MFYSYKRLKLTLITKCFYQIAIFLFDMISYNPVLEASTASWITLLIILVKLQYYILSVFS